MNKQAGITERIYRVIAGSIGWFGLLLQLFLIVRTALNDQVSLVSETIRFFSYFTILTNIIVALCFTAPLVSPASKTGKYFSTAYVQGGIAVYIAIVGITYSLVLRQLWKPEGWQLVADRLLHDIIPVAYLLFWLVFITRGNLKWRNILSWLIYPVVYLVYVLIRGAITDQYPYPFIDVTDLGYDGMLLNSLVVLAGFIVMGLAVIAIDKLPALNSKRAG